MKLNTCCFTGHRCQKLPWGFNEEDKRCIKIKEIVTKEIEKAINQGYTHFISGMAIGFDMFCAEIVLSLKNRYPFITLECALPCIGQEKLWSRYLQERYLKIINKADKTRCVYNKYENGCMQERNKYMINNSSRIIALYNGQNGGTRTTINYAKSLGLQIIIIKP